MLSKLSSPDSGTVVGLLTAAGVYLIYNNATPSTTDIHSVASYDTTVEGERKAAAWKSAALIGLVFLVARDFNSYIISGAALVGIDFLHKHANAVNPMTNKMDTSGDGQSIMAPGMSGDSDYPLPNYDVSNA